MSKVRIPPVLRPQTSGEREVTVEGQTVGDVLIGLEGRYPSLRDTILRDGELQKYVNVYLNDQDIKYLKSLETPAGTDDTIIILPAMAGGEDPAD